MTAHGPPDITMAREWMGQLDAWIQEHGLRGYDPFDVKEHPLIRAAQPIAPLRKATSLLLDVFPTTARRILRVKPTLNAKAFALVALGQLRLYQTTQDDQHLKRARQCLQWLRDNRCSDVAGWCWGYPFDVSGKGIHRPAGTPVGVVSAVAGEAFALAYRITGNETYRYAVRAIAEFFLKGVNRMPQDDGTVCFSYTPLDRWRVHNANLHAAAHLYRTSDLTDDRSLLEHAEPAVRFSLGRQREDGSWPYGEWSPDEGYEKALLDVVDHHHTGFVLRSLHEIHGVTQSDAIREALVRGFAFYEKNLFDPDGTPRITTKNTYPVNIHACTEGILCPVALADIVPGAVDIATKTLDWTRRHMADPDTGLPYYRKYRWFTNRLLCTRWGLAWTFYALCEYLARAEQKP